MSMKVIKGGKVRAVSSETEGKVLLGGRLRTINTIKAKIGGRVYTLWELMRGWIFTSDSLAVETSDGYMVKCSDQ